MNTTTSALVQRLRAAGYETNDGGVWVVGGVAYRVWRLFRHVVGDDSGVAVTKRARQVRRLAAVVL